MGEFRLLVELHQEGSAPAACAAGLFYQHVVCVSEPATAVAEMLVTLVTCFTLLL